MKLIPLIKCVSLIKIVSNLLKNCSNKLYCLRNTYILGLDYRDTSLKTLHLVVTGIIIPKIRLIG